VSKDISLEFINAVAGVDIQRLLEVSVADETSATRIGLSNAMIIE